MHYQLHKLRTTLFFALLISSYDLSGQIYLKTFPQDLQMYPRDIRLEATEEGFGEIQVIDMRSRTKRTQIIAVEAGNNRYKLPVNNLAEGVYQIRIGFNELTEIHRVVIMH